MTFCIGHQVAGTPREPDRLMYDGEKHFVHRFRVSEAMWKNYWDYRMRRGVDKGDLSGSTARGIRFVAHLAILDGKLFLVSTDGTVTCWK